MKVRALCSIMHEDQWRIPGTASEVFEITAEKYKTLGRFVERLDPVPVSVAMPKPKAATFTKAAPKKKAAPRKRTKK